MDPQCTPWLPQLFSNNNTNMSVNMAAWHETIQANIPSTRRHGEIQHDVQNNPRLIWDRIPSPAKKYTMEQTFSPTDIDDAIYKHFHHHSFTSSCS